MHIPRPTKYGSIPKFSSRLDVKPPDPEIIIRNGAPGILRHQVGKAAYDAGIEPKELREIVCDILCEMPDASNWSRGPVSNEVQALCAYNVRYTFASEIREQFRIRRWHPTWAIQLF